jgi:hypothetical protein
MQIEGYTRAYRSAKAILNDVFARSSVFRHDTTGSLSYHMEMLAVTRCIFYVNYNPPRQVAEMAGAVIVVGDRLRAMNKPARGEYT